MKLTPNLLAIVNDGSTAPYVATITDVQVGSGVTVQLDGANWVALVRIEATRYAAGLEEDMRWVARDGYFFEGPFPSDMHQNQTLQGEYREYLSYCLAKVEEISEVMNFDTWATR